MNILIINGPNLNLLGTREPEIYGNQTMEKVLEEILAELKAAEVEVKFFQSNYEGGLIDRLQQADFDAVIINPGAFTHYSIALADCLKNIDVPKVEVHISNIYQREAFRQKSVTAPHVNAVLTGFGTLGYGMAARYILQLNKKSTPKK